MEGGLRNKKLEEQKVGEVVSWPKISFFPNESAVLRGSQLWEQSEIPLLFNSRDLRRGFLDM